MIVENRIQDDEHYDPFCFYVVFFTTNEDMKSSVLIKLNNPKDFWEVQMAKESVSHPEMYVAKFVSGFQVK